MGDPVRMKKLATRWDQDDKRPSTSLYIRWYFGPDNPLAVDEDYPYRIWVYYKKAIEDLRREFNVPTYQSFRNYIYWLTRLGLLTFLGTDSRPPEQSPDSLVGERRGKQDLIVNVYKMTDNEDALENLTSLVEGGVISDEVFNTFIINPVDQSQVQANPVDVAWNNPRKILYADSYNENLPNMNVSRPPKRKIKRLSVGQLRQEIKQIGREIARRGGKIPEAIFETEAELEEVRALQVKARGKITPKEERRRERRELRKVEDPATSLDIIKLIAMDNELKLILDPAGPTLDQDRRAQNDIVRLSEASGVTRLQVNLAIARGQEEAERVASLDPVAQRDQILEIMKNVVRDVFSFTDELSGAPADILRSVMEIQNITDDEFNQAIQRGIDEAGA